MAHREELLEEPHGSGDVNEERVVSTVKWARNLAELTLALRRAGCHPRPIPVDDSWLKPPPRTCLP